MKLQFEFDFFISHAVKDQQEVVIPLVTALQEAGAKVWYSGRDLRKGMDVTEEIDRALRNSRACIVICSPYLVKYYENSWVRLEVSAFFNLKSRPLIPLFWNVSPEEVQKKSLFIASKTGCRYKGELPPLVNCLLAGQQKEVSRLSKESTLFQNTQGLKVLILPFLEVEENKHTLSLDNLLSLRLADFNEDFGIEIQVVSTTPSTRLLSAEQARLVGEKNQADLVVWGEHYAHGQRIRFRYVWIAPSLQLENAPKRSRMIPYRCLSEITEGEISGELENMLLGIVGMQAYRKGAFEKAIAHWTNAQKLADENSYAFYLGIAYERLGEWEKAQDHYEFVPQTNLDFRKACLNLGNISLDQGKWEKARQLIQTVLSGDQFLGEAYNNLAILEHALGNIEKAIGALSNAMKISPEVPMITYNYFYLLQKEGLPAKEKIMLTSQGKSWIKASSKTERAVFELQFSSPLRLISFRNDAPRSLEELQGYLKEKGHPFLFLNQLRIPLSKKHFPVEEQYVWGLGGTSAGKTWVNVLKYEDGFLWIRLNDLYRDKEARLQAQGGRLKRSLYYVKADTGKVLFKEEIEINLPHFSTLISEILRLRQFLTFMGEQDVPTKIQQILWNEYGFIPQADLRSLLPPSD